MTPTDACSPLVLEDAIARVSIRPDMGASIADYGYRRGSELVPVLSSERAPSDPSTFDLGCQLLAPWSNRISGGGFDANGAFHGLEPNVAGEPFPLHGNAWQNRWTVVSAAPRSLELRLRSTGPGPFDYRATVRYGLERGTLTIALTLENLADVPLPHGAGFHPWFERTPATRVHVDVDHVWLENEHHLPTEHMAAVRWPAWTDRPEHGLPAGWINNAFDGWNGRMRIEQPDRGIDIDVRASSTLPIVILYSPGEAAGFLCAEPVSHPVDAHNRPPERTRYLAPLGPGGRLDTWMTLAPSSRTCPATA